jgi:[ribosomal protein S18]-alanine N-acetyltransferase
LAFAPEQKPEPLAVCIRDMQVADVAEVYAIEVASYSQPWPLSCFLDELTKNHFAQYFVAESENQVVGYAGQWAIADEGHITTIAVDYGFRRRRVAEQLLVSQIEYSLDRRAAAMFLEVRRYNIAAQRLYSRYRFMPVRVRERYYQDNNEDAIEMRAECVVDERFIPNFLRYRGELRESLGL